MILLKNGIKVPFLIKPKQQSILEHMKMSKIQRQEHCDLDDLDSPCDWHGVNKTSNMKSRQSRYPRIALAMYLSTDLPDGSKYHIINGIKSKIQAAHVCNGQCFNPLHLYWATHQENNDDKKINYYKFLKIMQKSA